MRSMENATPESTAKRSRKRSVFAIKSKKGGSSKKRKNKLTFSKMDKIIDKHDEFVKIGDKELKEIDDKYGYQFRQSLGKDRFLSRKLGSGAFGTTYLVCSERFSCFAAKIQSYDDKELVHHEIEMQRRFHEAGCAPNVVGQPTFYSHRGKDFAVIRMETINTVLGAYLSTNELTVNALDEVVVGLFKLIAKMRSAKLTHGDMHSGNIGVSYAVSPEGVLVPNFQLIDFGWSITGSSNTLLELMQFYRTIQWYDTKLKPDNKAFILDVVLRFIDGVYGLKKIGIKDIDDRHEFERVWELAMNDLQTLQEQQIDEKSSAAGGGPSRSRDRAKDYEDEYSGDDFSDGDDMFE
jgi:tRNA A-37 threonylcarbamoyl transferase component Bud32